MFIKNRKVIIVYCLMFVSIYLLTSLFVPTHDDYIKECGLGLSGSIQFMSYVGNGRFLGNFLGYLLSLNSVANNIIKTCVFFSMIICMSYIADDLSSISLAISYLIILFPSVDLFSQCYVWSMGFYNYTFPIFLLLLALVKIKKIETNRSSQSTIIDSIILSLLGLTQMLFSENEAVIFLLISIVIFYFSNKSDDSDDKQKIINNPILYYMLFSLLGALLIFCGPRLFGFYNEVTEQYREIYLPSSGITTLYILGLIERYSRIQGWIFDCYILWGLIFLYIVYSYIKKEEKTKKDIVFIFVVIFIYIISILLKFHIIPIQKWNIVNLLFSFSSTLLEVILIFWMTLKKKTILIVLLLISFLELIIVLLPGAIRCIYISYILLSLYLLISYSQVDVQNDKKVILPLVLTVSIIVYILLFFSMYKLKIVDSAREEYIKIQMDKRCNPIEIILLPESKLLFFSRNYVGYYGVYFYEQPGDTDFVPITYEEYIQKTQL